MKKTWKEVAGAIGGYFTETMRHPVGFLGISLTSVAGVLLLVLLALEVTGGAGNPYLGIVTFGILPVLFLGGLALMPLGHWLDRRRAARQGVSPDVYPRIDFNRAQTRSRALLFIVVSLVNLSLVAVVSYHGIEFLDSVEFCGETCHEVMHPELTAYRNSPHARVRCVDCHIGPGASWFVKSKLSGTRQVFAAMLHTFPRPIPTPVHNLRPARETCEQCHWPSKFHGNKLMVKTHFQDDKANTEVQTVLALRVGGGQGHYEGPSIHWHVNNKVEYASDEDRETIYWVRAERQDGTVREYRRAGSEEHGSAEGGPTRRVMDCVDCHNRPTHIYKPAIVALDEALNRQPEALDLPYLRREALAALETEYADKPAAVSAIAEHLRGFYSREFPETAAGRAEEIDRAVLLVQKVYADNVFPSMKIGWDTYPNHIGHQFFPGCFRCHNEDLATNEGETIGQDCSTCHTLLAVEEENPEILQSLFPEE